MRSGVGSAGGHVVLQRGFWGQLILTCFCAVSTVLSDFAPSPLSLSGKYEVSIMVPVFLQCDGAWWLPLTGLSWLPYNPALVHRVVKVTLRARLLCSRLHYLSRHLSQARLLMVSLTSDFLVYYNTNLRLNVFSALIAFVYLWCIWVNPSAILIFNIYWCANQNTPWISWACLTYVPMPHNLRVHLVL